MGGGAAGIALALEFEKKGIDCILAEGGGLRPNWSSQSLYEGEDIGTPYDLVGTRTRYIGGSTNCWGSYCAPMEDWYLEQRLWVPHSGWPIAAGDLRSYYPRTCALLGIDCNGFDADLWEQRLVDSRITAARIDNGTVFTAASQRAIERGRFGTFFRSDLRRAQKANVLVNATVADVQLSEDGTKVKRLRVLADTDSGFWIEAKVFILAAGGVENPRLLLLSNTVHASGIGNEFGVVGRYFMEHPLVPTAAFQFADRAGDARHFDSLYTYLRNRPAIFSHRLSRAAEERNKALYAICYIEPVFGDSNKGVESLKHFHRFIRTLRAPDDLGLHLSNLIRDFRGVAALARYLLLSGNSGVSRWELTTSIECSPNPDSRITLSSEKDRLGMNKVRLDWRLTELDRHTMRTVVLTVAEEFAKSGTAKVDPYAAALDGTWTRNPGWINHHMGTTRMGVDPRTSVVDSDCRVHGVTNLYIAGSSVFPCAPSHSPTFTILALALRLADHVAQTTGAT